jgi:hypothetical protein
MKDKETHSHPSYGQLYIGRVNGSARFYGSELPQDHYITIELSQSELNRDLSKEWYFAKQKLFKIRMSANQFAEAITSLNMGGGVPCTIEYANENKIEALPEIDNRKEFVHNQFQKRMKDFSQKLKENQLAAQELINKKTLSKQDQETLNGLINVMTQEVSSNIPFFAKCFQETMDDVVKEAKTEIDSAIQHKINMLGLEKLHEQNKLIE